MRPLLASLIFLLSAPALAQQPATIKVSAEATVSGKPDLGIVDLGVVSEGKTAEAAAAENARKMDRLLPALRREVGAGGQVNTADYSVEQRYGESKSPNQRPPIVGYIVSNIVRLRVHDVAIVGKVIDQALKEGANDVRSLSFTFKDPEPLRAEALRAATAKAKARAYAIATALALRLGPVLSATDGSDGGRPPIPFAGENKLAMMRVSNTPIEAGTLEIGATVTLVFSTAAR